MKNIKKIILIHYGEIALKKGNRKFFVNTLKNNIKEYFAHYNPEVNSKESRIILFFNHDIEFIKVKEIIKKISGVSSFGPAFITDETDLIKISELIYENLFKNINDFKTFAISTKRSYKGFPYKSTEINSIVGKYIKEKTSKIVNLSNPDVKVVIEVLKNHIIFYSQLLKGMGGLPSGTSGTLISLISGGIDSPVAAWRMIKRGAKLIFVHFHSYPYHPKTSQEKVKEIVKILTQYQINSILYLVPFGEIQAKVKTSADAQYRIVIYRRLMLKIAQKISQTQNAFGIVTGESLGQVSSQTLYNISVINSAVKIPVFRPLIGMDKNEIINQAKEIGTFDISTIKDEDCCQLFTPKHPATKTNIKTIEKIEEKIEHLDILMSKAIEEAEIINFNIKDSIQL